MAVTQIPSAFDTLIVMAEFPGVTSEVLFNYWTEHDLIVKWWPQEAEIDPGPGGTYHLFWPQMNWHLRGHYTVFELGKKLAFTWKWDHEAHNAEVAITLESLAEAGTKMTLTQGPYSASQEDQELRIDHHLVGWKYFITKLQNLALARLYILCGLPFAGKSTLAGELSKAYNLACVAMDTINTERGLGLHGDAISEEDWDKTYQEAYRRIESFLTQGQSVIYDAPSFTKEQRDQLRAIAYRRGVPAKVIFVDVPEHVVRERRLQNRRTGNRFDVRDDDFAQVVDNFQPPTDEEDVIRYDQMLPLNDWIHQVFHL